MSTVTTQEFCSDPEEALELIEQGSDGLTITRDGHPIAELRPIGRRTRTVPPSRHPVRRDPEYLAEIARNNQRVFAQMANSRSAEESSARPAIKV